MSFYTHTDTQHAHSRTTMLKHTLQGHKQGVSCVAVSGDSKRIASGSRGDASITLWCADTGQHVRTFQGLEFSVRSLDFKGQSTLVSGGADNVMKVWALSDDGEAPALLHTLTGHTHLVLTVKVSPDGMKIASGSWDKTVMIWSVQSGEQLLTYRGHQANIMCVAWSSDSRLVASGGTDRNVCMWDAAEGTQVMEPLRGHGKAVLCVVLNTTTTLLFSASYDKTIIIWDLDIAGRKATVRHTLQGHTGGVNSISLCPDERLIVSGSDDKTARVWEAATAKQVRVLEGHTAELQSVVWSRDGQYIVSGSDDNTRVWEADVQVCTLDMQKLGKCVCIYMLRAVRAVTMPSIPIIHA
jgi:WD40 repeat protein